MKEWAELLRGIGAAAWPLVALIALLVFKADLRALLKRLHRGKLLGQEIELASSLERLEKDTAAAQAQLPALPAATAGQAAEEPVTAVDAAREAARSPKAALMLVAAALERELRDILAVTGLHKGKFNLPAKAMLQALSEHGMIPSNLSGMVDAFWAIRNRIVHGVGASDSDTLQALDSGFALLGVLRSIPRALYIVKAAGLDVYSDPEGNNVRPGVKAVLLEAIGPGGLQKTTQAFPTTRNHFVVGRRVAWEWNQDNTFGESWYRDPATGALLYGWTGSMEFVGRLLEDVEEPSNTALKLTALPRGSLTP